MGRHGKAGDAYVVYPPSTGWPEVLSNSKIEFVLQQGVDMTAASRAIAQAVILLVRQLYDGYREIRKTEAFYALLMDWRYYGPVTSTRPGETIEGG